MIQSQGWLNRGPGTAEGPARVLPGCSLGCGRSVFLVAWISLVWFFVLSVDVIKSIQRIAVKNFVSFLY